MKNIKNTIALALISVISGFSAAASSEIDPIPRAICYKIGIMEDLPQGRVNEAMAQARKQLLEVPALRGVECYIARDHVEYVVIWLIPAYDYNQVKDQLMPLNMIILDILNTRSKETEKGSGLPFTAHGG